MLSITRSREGGAMKSLDEPTPVGGVNGLIDVTPVPLEKLGTLGSAALRELLKQLTEEAKRPSPTTLFSFNSAM
jgi:FXSXX-COOH protein